MITLFGKKKHLKIEGDIFMYSKDFIERMGWITDSLDSVGMLFYEVDSHDYYTGGCCLDTCSYNEDIDYILGYLKENYQKRKGLYKVSWLGNPVGLAVGYDNLKELVSDLKADIRSMEECRYHDRKFDIEKEKIKLFDMKFFGADDSKIAHQKGWIAHLEEELKKFWKQLEENFKDNELLKIERIR